MSQIKFLFANDLTYLVIVFLDLVGSHLGQVAVYECLGWARLKALTGRCLLGRVPLLFLWHLGEALLAAWLIQF